MSKSTAVSAQPKKGFRPSFNWRAVTWATAAHFVIDLYMNTIPPLLPYIAKVRPYHDPNRWLTVQSITGSSSAPVGLCLDRWERLGTAASVFTQLP